MKKTEKQRFDFDLDFLIGFGAGILANLLAQWIYDKWIVDKIKKNEKLAGLLKKC